jgi:hypothetical protein
MAMYKPGMSLSATTTTTTMTVATTATTTTATMVTTMTAYCLKFHTKKLLLPSTPKL